MTEATTTAQQTPQEEKGPVALSTAEAMAMEGPLKLDVQSLPAKEYLEKTVIPLLLQGMNALVKERPPNPVEYLAVYLLEHVQTK